MTEAVETNGHGKIYGLMATVLSEVGSVGKGRRNEQQGYRFRGIDDVYEAVHPLFAKHGIFTLPRVLSEDTSERTTQSGTILRFVKLTMAYDFFAPDGSHVTAEVVGEAMDAGDKASNKAMSAAQKYALIQTLCIPTGDNPDTEEQTHEVTGEKRQVSKSSTASEKCPKCGGPCWDNREGKRNPKAPDYKCKNKSCDGAIWLQKTEGFGTDAALRDQLFNQAEKYMIARHYPEDKRKDALGRLVAMTTEEMGKAVDKLVTGAKPEPDALRQKKIEEITANASEENIVDYVNEHFNGKPLKDLDLDALTQMAEDLTVPF